MKSSLAKKIYPKSTIQRINKKNKLLGIDYSYNTDSLLISHLLITIFIFIIIFILKNDILLASFASFVYFLSAEYLFFDLRLKKRGKLLEKDAVFYFQILALTLESGSNLKGAIELTSSNVDSTLSREFKRVIDDINLGKSLTEALNDLKLRIPSDAVNNIIINLLESNIYGNNMIDSLNSQLDYLNDKILLETKAKINKMPIKISIVSVLMFVPLLLMLILSPFIIRLITNS